MKLLAVCALVPILFAAFQDLGSKYGGMDWLTIEYFVWPAMISPVLMLALLIGNRELIRDPRKGANFSQTIKIVSCLYLIPNVMSAIGYSWLAVISLLASVTILVADRLLKKQASA
ncbi:hypothetical protein ABT381_23375 [Streptomyces sp. NPDC000151]|uniref:hypothetical protein n=1 Tax=Streptomyces sp. NPDC000151 TaxID=3154244 RepID=UPI00332FD5D5